MIFSRDLVLSPEDLAQEADLAEWRAENHYGRALGPALRHAVRENGQRNAIRAISHIRRVTDRISPPLFPAYLASLPGDPLEYLPGLWDERTPEDIVGRREILKKYLDSLPVREGKMVEMLLSGHTQREVAAEFAVTEQRISQILQGLMSRLRGSAETTPADIDRR